MVKTFAAPRVSLLQRLIHKSKGMMIALFLFSTILLMNALQFLTLPLYLISPAVVHRMNRSLAFIWWGTIVVLMKKVQEVDVVIDGDPIPPRENVILIANHQQMTDILVLFFVALAGKRLGEIRWFVKDAMKYVPGPGWALYLARHIFVRRDWHADKGRIDALFANIIAIKAPIWLVIFVEGTRRTAAKLAKSQEFCAKAGRPILKNVLAPRTKGFTASVGALRNHIDAVYDVTIAFPEGVPLLRHIAEGYVRRIDVHVRRYPIGELPHGEEALANWAWDRFVEKDQRLEKYS